MMALDIAPGLNRSFLAEQWTHLVPKKMLDGCGGGCTLPDPERY